MTEDTATTTMATPAAATSTTEAAACVEAGCEHGCRVKAADETESAECFCQDGYVLAEDGKSCEDVDECSADDSNGGCEVYCRNLAGSYECICRLGYLLESDKKTCKGNTGVVGWNYFCAWVPPSFRLP